MKRVFQLFATAVACIIMWWASGCSSHSKEVEAKSTHAHEEESLVEFSEAQAKSAGLEWEDVEPGEFTAAIKVSGEIIAPLGEERTLAAPASGIVNFSGENLNPGTPVAAGKQLFHISAKNLAQADNTAPMRAALESARIKYERAKALVEDNLISRREYDEALAEYQAARTAFNTPDVKASNGGVGVASPISGYVANCMVTPGQYVETGQPLAVVTTTRRLQLRADVPLKYASQASAISSANFVLPHNPNAVISTGDLGGRVVSVGQRSTEGSLYFPILLEFDNPGGVMPGTAVETYLLTAASENVISVPRSALTEEEDTFFVFTLHSPGHYEKKEVTTGRTDGSRVEILSGLSVGDKVVTNGAYHLRLAANSGKAPEGHTHNH